MYAPARFKPQDGTDLRRLGPSSGLESRITPKYGLNREAQIVLMTSAGLFVT
jgi:hypothetical protein